MSFWESHRVGENYDGWRLDRFLTQEIRRASRSQVRRMLKGEVRITPPRKVKPGTIVRAGDLVELLRQESLDPATPGMDALGVLVDGRDARIPHLILNKPAGLLVHRSSTESSRTVMAYLETLYPDARIEAVHRLDRDTSGCLVCGVGGDAIRTLRGAFAGEAEVDKRYWAVVNDPAGRWQSGASASLATPLGFDPTSAVKLRIGEGDWPCETRVRVLRRQGSRAWLEAQILGGRQHQIRAHLMLEGTPIVGDKLYAHGNPFFIDWITSPGDPALVAQLETRWHCLHARSVSVELDRIALSAEAPAPPHFDVTTTA